MQTQSILSSVYLDYDEGEYIDMAFMEEFFLGEQQEEDANAADGVNADGFEETGPFVGARLLF